MKTKEFFDKFAQEYESQSRYRFAYYRWLVDWIVREAAKPNAKVVDYGAGNGELALRIAATSPTIHVTGIDISRGMLEQARMKAKNLNLNNVKFMEIKNGAMVGKNIDCVVSSMTFHHIKNKAEVMENIQKSLKHGGKLIIGDCFKRSKRFSEETETLRRKRPRKAEEFDKSLEEFYSNFRRFYGSKHPREYLISPYGLAKEMQKAGFSRQSVINLLLFDYAVVIGEK